MKLFSILFLTFQSIVFANNPNPEKINWISFEEAIELTKKNPKPIIIDVYTDWCSWCKVMDKKTFSHPIIAKYIDKNYYAVKFNAEQKEPLTYNGKTFKFLPNGRRGIHEFALQILNGKASFPSVVFFTKNEEYLQAIPGYQSKEQMEVITHFFAEEAYMTTDWETFSKAFKSEL